jgi:hypothetical protein
VISGFYGGAEFTSPTQADAYISSFGLHISATYDPEGFWGQFSQYIPSNVIINLNTMQIAYKTTAMDANDIRNALDQLLGL